MSENSLLRLMITELQSELADLQILAGDVAEMNTLNLDTWQMMACRECGKESSLTWQVQPTAADLHESDCIIMRAQRWKRVTG